MLQQVTLDAGDGESASEACVELAMYYQMEGDFSLAVRYSEQALEHQGASTWALATAGVLINAARSGLEKDVDLQQLQGASMLSESIGEFYTAGLGWSILADCKLAAGEYRLAVEEYRRASDSYMRAETHLAAARIALSTARAYDYLNDPEQATKVLEQAVAYTRLAAPTLGRKMLERRLLGVIESRQKR